MLSFASTLPASALNASENESEQQQYAQQLVLPELGHYGQQQLKEAKVLVVGAGGLGGHALLHLASAGIGTLGICEGDVLEASNLNRQGLYTHQDIGKKKSFLAAQQLRAINPFITINPIPERLSQHNASRLLAAYDLALDCSDNFETQFLINQTSLQLGKAAIFASLYQYEGYVFTLPPAHQISPTTACLHCLWPEPPALNTSCHTDGTLSPVVGVLGSLQAMEALKLLLSLPCLTSELLTVNLLTCTQSRIRIPNNPNCPYHGTIPVSKHLKEHVAEKWVLSTADIEASNSSTVWIQLQSGQHPLPPIPPISLTGVLQLTEAQLSPLLFQNTTHQFILACPTGIRSKQIVHHLRSQGVYNVYAFSE